MIKYDDKFFDKIFPLLSFQTPDKNLQISFSDYLKLDNTDETIYNDCKFFFPDDPTTCMEYVDRKRRQFISENRFAYDACKSDIDPLKCCKLKSENNDIAYNLCVQNINDNTDVDEKKKNINIYIFLFVISFLIILIIFLLFYIYRRK